MKVWLLKAEANYKDHTDTQHFTVKSHSFQAALKKIKDQQEAKSPPNMLPRILSLECIGDEDMYRDNNLE